MSVIASAYKITESALLQAFDLFECQKYREFWEFFGTHEVGTLPYSGYVLAAVIPFAQLKGVEFPKGQGVQSLLDQHRKQLGIVACGKARDYENTAKGLDDLQAADGELARYYAELYDHKWDEAPTAMRQGFAFVQQGIRSLNSDDELLIFLIH